MNKIAPLWFALPRRRGRQHRSAVATHRQRPHAHGGANQRTPVRHRQRPPQHPRRLTNVQGQVVWQWLITGYGEVALLANSICS